jgi:RHS repeat-associated protein
LTSLAYTLNGNAVGDLTYSYDAAGRRTSVGGSFARTGLPQTLASAGYDAGNRIATWGGQTFSYDLDGNLASDGPTSYTWNARNQLEALSGAASASFQYDGVGRRRRKTVSGTTTNFLYDGLNFVQELTSGGTPTANLLTGLGVDETFTRADAGGTSTLLNDALGSTLAQADATGTVQTQYTFEPFGATTLSGATSTNAAQFTGRENDRIGTYFYRARYYSPSLQLFISEDPLEFGGGDVNLANYTGDSPTIWRDPSGLDVWIWYYPGLNGNPFGHVAISINDGTPIGFGPTLDIPGGPGVVEPIPFDSRRPTDSIRIPTTPDQDAEIWDYILQRARRPGWYRLTRGNCTNFVEDALRSGGINAPTTSVPRQLIPALRR